MTYLEQHRDEIFKKYDKETLLRDVWNYKNGKGRLTKFINQFFEECIFNCKDNRCKLTPMEALQNDEVMAKIIGAFAKNPKLYYGTEVANVKKSLSVSGIGARKVANFCPRNARTIYKKYFDDIRGLNILDTSSGFGSRMLAATLNGANYFGFDPNPELHEKLKECYNFLVDNKEVPDGQVCKLYCKGSEEHVPELDGKMDLSFTSPPYFNHETYASDSGTSTTNYNNYDGWLYEFVVPTLLNTYKYLKVGGLAMINIKNMVSRGKKPLYDDFMRVFQMIEGFEYVETFTMEHQHKRTLKEGMNYVGFQEPVMVYKKVAECENDPNKIVEMLKSGIQGVVRMKKEDTPKELHVVSVWREDATPAPQPKVEVVEEPVEVKEIEPPKPKYEIIVDSLDNIDPRAFAKLMLELKDKVDLTIVHGGNSTDDVVVKLCNGLGFKLKKLYNSDEKLYTEYVGKKKLVSCQAGQKPVFEVIEV